MEKSLMKRSVLGALLIAFLSSSTVFASNSWVLKSGKWNLLNDSGTALTGWQLDGGKKYFLNGDGSMATGWINYGGLWYYLQSGGDMKTGWLSYKGHWYYLNDNGEMAVDWKQVNSKTYYLNSDGSMVMGWKQINSKWYYFDTEGDMASNTVTPDGYTLGTDGTWDTSKPRTSYFNTALRDQVVNAINNYTAPNRLGWFSPGNSETVYVAGIIQPMADALAKDQNSAVKILGYYWTIGSAKYPSDDYKITELITDRIATASSSPDEILKILISRGIFYGLPNKIGICSIYYDASSKENIVEIAMIRYEHRSYVYY